MNDPLDQTHKRTLQYWYTDGIAELSLGGLCLLLGGYFYVQTTLASDSPAYQLLNLGFIGIVLGGSLFLRRIIQSLKERLTYPRTGYVAYRKSLGANRWLRFVLGFGVGILMAALATRWASDLTFSWMPALTGVIFALALMVWSYRTALLRFYLLAVFALLAGGGLGLSRVENMLGLSYFYLLVAVSLVVSGGITLWRYLRQYPLPPDARE